MKKKRMIVTYRVQSKKSQIQIVRQPPDTEIHSP